MSINVNEGLKNGDLVELNYNQLVDNLKVDNPLRMGYLALMREGRIRAFLIVKTGEVAFSAVM